MKKILNKYGKMEMNEDGLKGISNHFNIMPSDAYEKL